MRCGHRGGAVGVAVAVAGRWVGPFGVGLGLLARLAAVFPLPSRFSHIVFAFGHWAIPMRAPLGAWVGWVSSAARRNQSARMPSGVPWWCALRVRDSREV